MVLGALWCPLDKVREANERIREIKSKYNLPPLKFEIKWTKISEGKKEFYLDVLDYFFDDDDLHFRSIVIPKSRIDHSSYGDNHDDWYYKMYFLLLKVLLSPDDEYRIYLDIKDTRGQEKRDKLKQVLRSDNYDFDGRIVRRIQAVRSHEIELMQLTDLLIGAITYANRTDIKQKVSAKNNIIERFKKRSGYALTKTTLVREEKTNIFIWKGQEQNSVQ
jgi:hypothetical protein